jgi:coenzyme F420 hydrogenase subunit beta
MRIFGPTALMEHVHGKNLCVGCGGCVALCPYFKNYKGRTAQVFPCDIEHGRCHAHCPKAEVDLDELAGWRGFSAYEPSTLGGVRRLLASRAGDRWKGKKAQSGGTVSALIAFALDSGKITSAVLTDQKGGEPVPVLVTTPEAVERCAYSKYTAAPTISALNEAMNEGRTKIGVVATPCQATAVAQIRSNPLQLADFKDPVVFVVGLFCTWALDTRKLLGMLSEQVDLATIRKMDIPPPPAEVLIVDTTSGLIEFPLSEIRPLIPEGCRICPDMTAEWADVSVGVLEDEPEWNTLIVRTETGEALVNEAVQKGWLTVRELPPQSEAHLSEAAGNKKRRALIKAQTDGILNATGPCALRLNPQTVSAIIDGGEGQP